MNKKLNQVLSAVLLTAALLVGQTTNAQVSGTGTEGLHDGLPHED